MKASKYLKMIILVLLGIWAVFIGTAFGRIYNLYHSIQRNPDVNMPEIVNANISEETEQRMEGYWTVALFGLDSRNGSLGKGNQSDIVMICNVNLDNGEIKLASVYRDTYLKITQKGNYHKINQAYCDGGPAQAIETLNENLDLKLDDYAVFNWKAVAEAINILGGIDIEISKSEFKVINGFITETVKSTGIGSHHLKSAGMNHLDGVQAVAYARLRKMDTDFKRTERQRKVLSLVLEKARHAEFSVINNILVTVLPQVLTSIGFDDVIPLAKNIKKFHLGDTTGFPFKLEDAYLEKKDCVIPVTLEENVKHLHEFLFGEADYQPSDKVVNISQEIEARASKKRK